MSTCEHCGLVRDSAVTSPALPSSDAGWIFVCRTGDTEDHWIHRPEACRDELRGRLDIVERLRAALREAVPYIDREAREYGGARQYEARRLLERINDLGVPWKWA